MTDLVIDASALVEYLRWTEVGGRIGERISPDDITVQMPHSCPLEVVSALRGLVMGHKMTATDASGAVGDIDRFAAVRHSIEPLLPRIWALRHNLTTYDAAYVAIAEGLGAPLLTADEKFDTPAVTRLIDVEVVRR